MKQSEIYQCDKCGLEVGLRPPVTRPCPNCGGEFLSVRKLEAVERKGRNLYSPAINRIIDNEFESILEGIEDMLKNE